tara:strand:+ start:253 stop:423 length:171 start_codon:yes stop_codon:yes gene_type:complete
MAKLAQRKKKSRKDLRIAVIPKEIRDANKRLSGPGPHSPSDMKLIRDFYKNKKGKA